MKTTYKKILALKLTQAGLLNIPMYYSKNDPIKSISDYYKCILDEYVNQLKEKNITEKQFTLINLLFYNILNNYTYDLYEQFIQS
ncbi:hypothetical protein DID76_02465, partial [Candidatus Marinamargulisbacteria bacterium SCGC AG-414-C22]